MASFAIFRDRTLSPIDGLVRVVLPFLSHRTRLSAALSCNRK